MEDLFNTDFSNIKLLVVAGSFESDVDPAPYMEKSLKTIFDSYPDLKFFGFGAGAALLAPLAGIKAEFIDTKEINFLGRR